MGRFLKRKRFLNIIKETVQSGVVLVSVNTLPHRGLSNISGLIMERMISCNVCFPLIANFGLGSLIFVNYSQRYLTLNVECMRFWIAGELTRENNAKYNLPAYEEPCVQPVFSLDRILYHIQCI